MTTSPQVPREDRDRRRLRPADRNPGTGYYALHTAGWLSYTMCRARETGVENIIATRGDVLRLPYPDDTFDAAYLVATLGEVPDKQLALEEFVRVLKPGGRLVVGEGQPDPHMVGLQTLKELADVAGMVFERRTGGPLGYFAGFEAP